MITIKTETIWSSPKSASVTQIGKHQLIIDETAAMGGEGLGPNPMEYMFAGMAGCFIGMGKLVAKEKGLAITEISCRVEGDINPAGMMAEDPAVRPGCQEIRMLVEVTSSEPPEKIQEWLKITEKRCPVRDCVANVTPVKTTLV